MNVKLIYRLYPLLHIKKRANLLLLVYTLEFYYKKQFISPKDSRSLNFLWI